MGSKVTLGLGPLVTMELDAVKFVSSRTLRDKMTTACGSVLDGKDGRPEVLDKDGNPRLCGTHPKSRMVCPTCETTYTSYGQIPYRAYEAGTVELLIPLAEIEAAKDAAKDAGEQNTVRFVPMDELAGVAVLSGEPYAFIPRKDATPVTHQQYRLILLSLVKHVDEKGETVGPFAMLTRLKVGGARVKSVVVMADAKRNVLVVYETKVPEPLPREPPVFEPDAASLAQARAFVRQMVTEDVALAPEPDPLEPLVETYLAPHVGFPTAEEAAKRKAEKDLGVAIEEYAPTPEA